MVIGRKEEGVGLTDPSSMPFAQLRGLADGNRHLWQQSAAVGDALLDVLGAQRVDALGYAAVRLDRRVTLQLRSEPAGKLDGQKAECSRMS
jgi:hypothetical protein